MNKNQSKKIRILVIEDDKFIVRLICDKLNDSGYIADSVASGSLALQKTDMSEYDLLLVDYLLPDMTGKEMIDLLKQAGNEKPFIIMTGYGNERIAVEMMKLGAMDYVPKDTSFISLITAVVDRVTEQLLTRDQLQQSRKELSEINLRYRELFENSLDPVYITSSQGYFVSFNQAFVDLLGYTAEELKEMRFIDLIKIPEDRERFLKSMDREGRSENFETILSNHAGNNIYAIIKTTESSDEMGRFAGRQGIVHDITYRKAAEEEIKSLNRELE
ncbi:MAG: response regulator, partial [Candidatus Kapaibacterium sp.]